MRDLFNDRQITHIDGYKELRPLSSDYLLLTENIPCQNQQYQCPPQIQILSMDNLQPLPLFGTDTYVAQRYVYPSPSSEYVLFRDENSQFQLFVTQTGTLIDIFLGDIEASPVDSFDEYWLDNEHFVIADSQFVHDEIKVLIFDTHQQVNTFIDAYNWAGVSTLDRGSVYLSSNQTQLAYLSSGWEYGPTIHDIENDTYIRVRPNSKSFQALPGGEVYWHPSNDWVLLAEETLIAGGGAPSSRWLGVVRADCTMRRDLGWCWLTEICYGWLPSQVNSEALAEPRLEPLPTPVKIFYGNKWVTYLSWSPDGNHLAVDFEKGEMVIWNFKDEEVVDTYASLNHHWLYNLINQQPQLTWEVNEKGQYISQTITSIKLDSWTDSGMEIMAISPDGEQVVAYLEEIYGVFDRETQELIYQESNFAYGFANYSPDGKHLVEGSWFSSTHIYDTQTWEIVATLPNRGAFAAVFSPDGQYLAIGSSWDVQIWDVATLLGE